MWIFSLVLSLTTYYFQSQVAKLRSKNPCTRQALEQLLLKIDLEMLRITGITKQRVEMNNRVGSKSSLKPQECLEYKDKVPKLFIKWFTYSIGSFCVNCTMGGCWIIIFSGKKCQENSHCPWNITICFLLLLLLL